MKKENTQKQDEAKPKRVATEKQRVAGRANLAAYRAGRNATNVRSGVYGAIANGEVPQGIEGGAELSREVDALIDQMVADLGGEPTAQQRAILATQRTALLVVALADRYLRREGLIGRYGRPHALLGVLTSFGNLIRHNATVLGLTRTARRTGPSNLSEYLAEKGEAGKE